MPTSFDRSFDRLHNALASVGLASAAFSEIRAKAGAAVAIVRDLRETCAAIPFPGITVATDRAAKE